MPTPHNSAPQDAFAKTVLLPGDPLRAKFIADNFLSDVKQVNDVRNMLAYTGYYQGKKVSVMGSGMGIPSIAIYCTELYQHYGVENIIRIGSCGAYQKHLKLYDVILAQGACTDSNFAHQFLPNGGTYSALADFSLLKAAYDYALKQKIKVQVGNILSSDIFYNANPSAWKQWQALGVLAVEMEAYALFSTAAKYQKKALAILTVSDSLVSKEETTAIERERNFKQMVEIALNIA
ncbi:purine-nucleoside phosphorylase [bacterium]|jgi:purine-nucleoside phosphorylase|nr:purine-nucleoside phosphorylase [bacterium]